MSILGGRAELHVNKQEGKTNGERADESVTFHQVKETVP